MHAQGGGGEIGESGLQDSDGDSGLEVGVLED